MGLLPGQLVKHQGGLCEDCGEPSTLTMVGETDSFGSEYIDLCQTCYDKDSDKEPEEDNCEWCKKMAICSPVRDWEEGSNGPVYYVCSSCSQKQNEELAKMEEEWV